MTERIPALAAYLERLVEDPKELRSFRRDPEKATAAAGLSEKDKKVLLSGDPKRIRKALGGVDEVAWVIVIPWRE